MIRKFSNKIFSYFNHTHSVYSIHKSFPHVLKGFVTLINTCDCHDFVFTRCPPRFPFPSLLFIGYISIRSWHFLPTHYRCFNRQLCHDWNEVRNGFFLKTILDVIQTDIKIWSICVTMFEYSFPLFIHISQILYNNVRSKDRLVFGAKFICPRANNNVMYCHSDKLYKFCHGWFCELHSKNKTIHLTPMQFQYLSKTTKY